MKIFKLQPVSSTDSFVPGTVFNATASLFFTENAFGAGGSSGSGGVGDNDAVLSPPAQTSALSVESADSSKLPSRVRSSTANLEQQRDLAILLSISPAIASFFKPSRKRVFNIDVFVRRFGSIQQAIHSQLEWFKRQVII
jgi:hypothetical protein